MNEHYWWAVDDSSPLWLFKVSRPERTRAFAEHVSEKLASEFAGLFGIPAARVELGVRRTPPGEVEAGALVQSVKPSGWELHAGQELMSQWSVDYVPRHRLAPGHSPASIAAVLAGFGPPPGSDLPSDFDAFDTFAGYLVFDALVAHADRHDRNWAILIPPAGDPRPNALCASFDHANSLGFTLTAEDCRRRVTLHTVEDFALGGVAPRFERRPNGRPYSLVDIAGEAARLCSAEARKFWLGRLSLVSHDEIQSIVDRMPELADPTRAFIVTLLMINRERLLDAIH